MEGSCSGVDAVVLVTKVPLLGSSKTRLIPSIGAVGAVRLATAMLTDIFNIAQDEVAFNQYYTTNVV